LPPSDFPQQPAPASYRIKLLYQYPPATPPDCIIPRCDRRRPVNTCCAQAASHPSSSGGACCEQHLRRNRPAAPATPSNAPGVPSRRPAATSLIQLPITARKPAVKAQLLPPRCAFSDQVVLWVPPSCPELPPSGPQPPPSSRQPHAAGQIARVPPSYRPATVQLMPSYCKLLPPAVSRQPSRCNTKPWQTSAPARRLSRTQ